VSLVFEHPVVLAVVLLAVLSAAAAAQVGRSVARATFVLGLPFALSIALVNAAVVRDGATVLLRGWTVPVLGQLDVTLEATAYGAILGLRAMIALACGALLSAAVDPDALLRSLRRLGVRSSLTAALAVRMVPVLARDAGRLRDAQRCRGGEAASRLALVRAITAGALDRAVDVAAALEVRGYGGAGRPARVRRPWSRHDLGFAAAAAGLATVGALATLADWERFAAYPRLAVALDGTVLALAASLAALVLLPFADRRGVR
jgi:energy-coupling factor transport system permease protein